MVFSHYFCEEKQTVFNKGILLTGTCSNSGKFLPKALNKISRVQYAGNLMP